MFVRVFFALALALLAVAPLAARAQGLELKTEAFREVEQASATGQKVIKREPLSRALPGQEVLYVISYRNTGPKPAGNVVVDNPLPQGLVFVGGSQAGGPARLEVSVDGGQRYGALNRLSVALKTGGTRPATAADVSHLRWTLTELVAPGAQGQLSYRAKLP